MATNRIFQVFAFYSTASVFCSALASPHGAGSSAEADPQKLKLIWEPKSTLQKLDDKIIPYGYANANGVCYLVDEKTGGKLFKEEANESDETATITKSSNPCRSLFGPVKQIWMPTDSKKSGEGNCILVDEKTNGKAYFEPMLFDGDCENQFERSVMWFPKNPKRSGEGECYSVDTATGGMKYKYIAPEEYCKARFRTQRMWFADQKSCFLVDAETGGMKFKLKQDRLRNDKMEGIPFSECK